MAQESNAQGLSFVTWISSEKYVFFKNALCNDKNTSN